MFKFKAKPSLYWPIPLLMDLNKEMEFYSKLVKLNFTWQFVQIKGQAKSIFTNTLLDWFFLIRYWILLKANEIELTSQEIKFYSQLNETEFYFTRNQIYSTLMKLNITSQKIEFYSMLMKLNFCSQEIKFYLMLIK